MQNDILQGIFGGALMGIAASLMLIFNGRTAGISGIYNGILQFFKGDVAWRIYFILGLLGGGFIIAALGPETEEIFSPIRSLSIVAIGGIFVGFGTVMSAGCTIGHGICGLSRFSKRSFAAVLTFVLSGMFTATIYHLLTSSAGGQ